MNMKRFGFLLFGGILLAPTASYAQRNAAGLDDASAQVLRTVAGAITAANLTATTTVIAAPTRCWPAEGALCHDAEFTSSARAAVERSAAYFAALRGQAVSTDPTADAGAHIAPASVDSAAPRSSWYRVCGADASGKTPARVAIVRPSAVRETIVGAEWRVVVMTASYPARGECLGYASANEYVVVRDTGSGAYRIAGTNFIGGGTGRVR